MDRLDAMHMFVRVVETGSFTQVAREFATTQPTVTKQVAAMEARLKVRLLNRNTRGVSLTEPGTLYYEKCKAIVSDVAEAENVVQVRQHQVQGQLRIGSSVAFGRRVVIPLALDFMQHNPRVEVDLSFEDRYTDLVARVRAAEAPLGSERLGEAVARYFYKLMAYKDEYEVARLYSAPAFREALDAGFEGDFKLHFHLAPTFLARPDPDSGRIRKLVFGPWMLTAFKWLARFRRLRGTAFDPFGYHPERKAERQLIDQYEADLLGALDGLNAERLALLVELASLPEEIRGFGHIKAAAMARMAPRRESLLARLGPEGSAASRAA